MTDISDGTTTITPTLVLGYEASTESRNVFHQIIDRAAPDVSLSPDSLRNGRLQMFFDERTAAWEAHALHTQSAVFTLVDGDVPEANMSYVREGGMSITLDPQTRVRWLLNVGFQEVSP